jgi:hypothetical protein
LIIFYNIKNSESDIYAVQVPDEEATDTLIATELAIKHMNLIIIFMNSTVEKKQIKSDMIITKCFILIILEMLVVQKIV